MESDSEGNPFYDWVKISLNEEGKLFNGKNVGYIPNQKAVKAVLSKSGVTLKDFKTAEKFKSQYSAVRKEFLKLWSTPIPEAYDGTSVEFFSGNYKITSKKKLGNVEVRFIAAWISTPSLGKYLLRILRGNGENDDNPFNELAVRQDSSVLTRSLPDITYLPELYKILGVENFEDMRISGTGDWVKVWKDIIVHTTESLLTRSFQLAGVEGREHISVLWGEDDFKFTYFERLPKVVLDRLKLVVAQNRATVPPTQWKKDPFQAITSGNLRGRDLISLCNTSREVNSICNANDQQLFKNHLLTEFGLDWSRNRHGFNSARELYKQMHTRYEYMTISAGAPHKYGIILKGKDVPKLTPGTSIAILVPRKQFISEFSTLAVVIFPQVPELSYYVSGSIASTGPPDWEEFPVRIQTFEDEGVKSRISEKDLEWLSDELFGILYHKQRNHLVSDPIRQAEKLLDHQHLEILKKILPNFEKPKLILMWSEYRGH